MCYLCPVTYYIFSLFYCAFFASSIYLVALGFKTQIYFDMRQLLLSLLVLSLFIVACNNTPTVPPDRGSMLRTGKWKISAGTVTIRLPNGVKSEQTYWPNLRKICLRDDYIVFDSSNHGSVHNGGTSCSAVSSDSISFIWQLKNNGDNIDLLNIFTVVDSVAESVYLDASVTPNVYKVRFDTATTYRSNIVNGKISARVLSFWNTPS